MNNDLFPIERCFTLKESRSSIEQLLTTLGLSWKLQVIGHYVYTTQCILLDSNGIKISSGLGKGDKESSIVGALFEATEHLYTNFEKLPSHKISYIENTNFSSYYPDTSILPLSIVTNSPASQLPCLSYKSLSDKKNCNYPIGLMLPTYLDGLCLGTIKNHKDNFDYSRLALYSTNSGIAIGMNEKESIIHGLLEANERNTISNFLIKSFLLREPTSLRKINLESLPDDLMKIVKNIEMESDSEVRIFELLNKTNIPTYCTWIDNRRFSIVPHGFGSSLSRDHAIRRSLHEAAQIFLLDNYINTEEYVKTQYNNKIKDFTKLPFHLRCAQFDLGQLELEIGNYCIDYKETKNLQYTTDINLYLQQIDNLIKSSGETAFYTTLYTKGTGDITVTHSFMTGQDHFFSVMDGNPCLPSSLKETLLGES